MCFHAPSFFYRAMLQACNRAPGFNSWGSKTTTSQGRPVGDHAGSNPPQDPCGWVYPYEKYMFIKNPDMYINIHQLGGHDFDHEKVASMI